MMLKLFSRAAELAGSPWLRLMVWAAIPVILVAIGQYALLAPISDSARIFGLPYSDALGYLTGATRLISGLDLDQFSGRRPLYSGYLSSLLETTGNSLSLTCALQTLLVGAATWWFGKQVVRRFGLFAATLTVLIVCSFYLRFVSKTMTENLGLLLALVAWGSLQQWHQGGRVSNLLIGYASLSLGLVARAGPFLMLPAILICVMRDPRRVVSRGTLAALVALGAIPFVLARVYLWRLGSNDTEAFSNFALTLYGVARGGKGWMYAFTVFGPHVTMGEVYRASLDSILTTPSLFVLGAARAGFEFMAPGVVSATGFISMAAPHALRPIIWLLTQAAFLWGTWLIVGLRLRPAERFDLWTLGGVALSLPFAPPSDADAMRAYAVAIPLFATICAIGFQALSRALRAALRRGKGAVPAVDSAASAITLSDPKSRILQYFPHAILALVSIFLIRPLTRARPLSEEEAGSRGQVRRDLASARLHCAATSAYSLNPVYRSSRISSIDELASTQRRHPYPLVFDPLKQAFEKSGAFDFAYGFSEESGTMWALALPISVTHARTRSGRDSLEICADRLVGRPNTRGMKFTVLLATGGSW